MPPSAGNQCNAAPCLAEKALINFHQSRIEELRARIVKLSEEINLQKELLRKLERDKSLVQRQLNVSLDPMARLPLEISSEILLECLPPLPEPPPQGAPPSCRKGPVRNSINTLYNKIYY
ncbi:hypothetical protein B0H19DRAFT_1235139 [Mycena capillaripes]|nr:hypothetical protein B0H19DRAFT_1235139 [Mycena capillaripes]